MAAFPQPAIHIHAPPLPPGPFLRTHPPFPLPYPPSCFPFPAGWDPSVSLAHPYIYDPTQVKHRRRTTPEQLRILENTFKTDPKPNAALRKQLSLEIGMTPRVLQVWFQNRRMKVKREAKKSKTVRQNASAEPERPRNSDPTDPASPASQTPATADNQESPPRSPPASTPSRPCTPATDDGVHLAPPQPLDAVRRGSLPAALDTTPASLGPDVAQARHAGSPFEGIPDSAILRRHSMTALQRLESHPFASFVATSGLAPTHTVVPPTPPAFPPPRPTFPHHHHSPSTPAYAAPSLRLQQTTRAASFHAFPTTQHLHAFHQPHTTAHPYAFPPRPLQPPLPGPLPAPDYSFGTPPPQRPAQEEFDVRPYVPPGGSAAFSVRDAAAAAAATCFVAPRDDDTDTEYSSRFGSIASDASGSPSASGSGASAWGDGERRGSWTGHVAEMLSGLDVGGGKADAGMWAEPWPGAGSAEGLTYPQDALEQDGPAAYGGAYEAQEDRNAGAALRVPISQTSELAYALCGSGSKDDMLEMHHALASYAEHPSVSDDVALGGLTDSAPYNLY